MQKRKTTVRGLEGKTFAIKRGPYVKVVRRKKEKKLAACTGLDPPGKEPHGRGGHRRSTGPEVLRLKFPEKL